MFETAGGRIKNCATAIAWIGIICSVVFGIIQIAVNPEESINYLLALIYIAGGSFVAWLSSLFTYAFGQLVENSDRLVRFAEKAEKDRIVEAKNTANAKVNVPISDAAAKEAPRTENAKVEKPIINKVEHESVEKVNDHIIICKKCGTKQRSDRTVCQLCGAKFE